MPVRMTIIKKTRDSKYYWGCGGENTCVLLVEMWIGTDTMEDSMDVTQKVKKRITIWYSNYISYSWEYIQGK